MATADGDAPPCMTDPAGLCLFTKDHSDPELRLPFQLVPGERRALEVYETARALSEFDERGLPTLSNLDTTLRELHYELEPGERRALLQRVAIIHNTIRGHELNKLSEKNGSE